MGEQPSVEMFENLLWEKINPLDKLILESESRKIGSCVLPEGLWVNMLNGKVIELQVSFEQRLHRLTNEYAGFDSAVLAERTEKLRKRLGGLACEQGKIAILEGRKQEWVELLMGYYDKSYNYFMEENGFKPNSLDWDWSQTENSLNLLKEKLKEYGITK
jgi:tRNA 2-selenouridine synthase